MERLKSILKMNKNKIIIAVVLGIIIFAFGRWSAPEKVRIETKIVEVEKKESETKKKKHKKTVVVKNPDGSETTTTIEDETTERKKKSDRLSENDSIEQTTKSTSRLNISALVGKDPLSTNLLYGGHVSRDLIGPVSVGVFGLSNKTAGFSLGLTF